VLGRLTGVPETLDGIVKLRQKLQVVSPGDFSNGLWEILAVNSSNSLLESGQPFDDGSAPTLGLLPSDDHLADIPV
jgi:hypothetical protein